MSLADYDDLVARMQAAGVGHDAAHRYAADKFPAAAREREQEGARRENVLEKDEQREVRKLFLAFGFEVYWLSQARKTGQTPGVPDLWCMHRELPIAFWFEVKREKGGRYSEPQIRFRELARQSGIGYVCGDRHAARNYLISLGIAEVVGSSLEPIARQR